LAIAPQNTREHGCPDRAVVPVHREFIQEDVTGVAAESLRVGRKANDPHAVRYTDLQTTTGHRFAKAVPVPREDHVECPAMLLNLEHQLAALALPRRKENLVPPPLDASQKT